MKKKVLTTILIILLIIALGIIIFFSLRKASGEKYLEVEIGTNITSNQLALSSSSKNLAPNSVILDKRVEVYASKNSSNVFVRAKIIFESNSDDNRVLSFVSQLNKYIGESATHSEDNYSWQYFEADNSFYLIKPDGELNPMSNADLNYLFLDKLVVPSKIEQIGYLNNNGTNVQVGEDITIKVVFEAVQSNFIADGKKLNVENVREYFNRTSVVSENGFIAQNGIITSYTGSQKNLVLPKYVQNEYILGIDSNAFEKSTTENVIIPANYITINSSAFTGCSNLKFVSIKNYIPINLKEDSFNFSSNLKIFVPNISYERYETLVSTYPYKTCVQTLTLVESTSLENVDKTVETLYLPNVKTLNQSFEGFSNLKYVYAPYLEEVSGSQFKSLTNLLDVEIPNATSVGANAFQGCSNLLTLSINKNLQTIGEFSFNSCSSLKDVNFISNLIEIPNSAFRYCTSLNKVTLNADSVVIGTEAFANSSITSIKIANLSQINSSAFANCTTLTCVRIDGGTNPVIEGTAFEYSTNAQIVFTKSETKNNLSDLITTFGTKVILINVNNAEITKFEGSINTLTLSNIFDYSEINSIKDNAFEEANIKHLYLNSNITKIGKSAFANSNITNLYINSYLMPELDEETFKDVQSNFTLKVPNGVLSIYKSQITDINIESL